MKKDKTRTLDRDQQILSRLARIEHKVDSLDQTTAFALRADAAKHFDSVRQIFTRSKRRAQVYLAANGSRGVQEIAAYLGIPRQNVTPVLSRLREEGLLEIIDTQGGKDVWAKKPVDRTLRISRFLQEEFSLDSGGRPVRVQKKKRTLGKRKAR